MDRRPEVALQLGHLVVKIIFVQKRHAGPRNWIDNLEKKKTMAKKNGPLWRPRRRLEDIF